jgi:transposase InsO family protein
MSQILLKDVLYAPNMGATLISISKIAAVGFRTVFHKDLLKIFRPRDSMLGCINVQNGLYRVEHEPRKIAASATTDTVTIEELHQLMGHIAPEVAKKLVEDELVEGIKLDKSSSIQSCDSCKYAKAHRKAIQKEREVPRASEIGEEVDSDVWGPAPVQTINGREYYSSYTDDYSHYTHLYLLHTKDQNFDAYKSYEAELWTQCGAHIKKLHSDHGGKYLSGAFDKHLAKAGTLWSLTVHDTPEYNGVLERLTHGTKNPFSFGQNLNTTSENK